MKGDSMAPAAQTTRLAVDDYLGMVRAGDLDGDDRVELLEGVVVEKMAKNPPHVLGTKRTCKALAGVLPPGWGIAKEAPIRLADSVAKPDVAVLRGDDDGYALRLPRPEHIGLIVEVADTTLQEEQTTKMAIYASAGIPAYWIANVPASCLIACSEPSGSDYLVRPVYGPNDFVTLILDGRQVARIAVKYLLPWKLTSASRA